MVSKAAEQSLERLAEALDIPDSRYEAAERSYRSLGSWLERPESSVARFQPRIYAQGSFRLGTVIRPASEDEHYDLDVVCELAADKDKLTQRRLKRLLGDEIEAYAERHGMAEPGESRRCWTLEYSDSAQFHMDALPSVPDGRKQTSQLASRNLDARWAATAIAITDKDHPHFDHVTEDWPSSNPKGYSQWFVTQMRVRFEEQRRAVATRLVAKAEDIPDYQVKTPLQQAIKILKRHRDVMFDGRPHERPISVILTTLAARSYRQEDTIGRALVSILASMDQHIQIVSGDHWIANPTDQRENFADRWKEFPERRVAFYEWLAAAREDFATAAAASDYDRIVEALAPRMGRRLVETAVPQRSATASALARGNAVTAYTAIGREAAGRDFVGSASHRQPSPWPVDLTGLVRIRKATLKRSGFRTQPFASGGAALPKGASLVFDAETTIRRPFRVYWQVTNTGVDAVRSRGLRGGFQEGHVERGYLTRHESTAYSGVHGIECLIVKGAKVVARSGIFVVNVG